MGSGRLNCSNVDENNGARIWMMGIKCVVCACRRKELLKCNESEIIVAVLWVVR